MYVYEGAVGRLHDVHWTRATPLAPIEAPVTYEPAQRPGLSAVWPELTPTLTLAPEEQVEMWTRTMSPAWTGPGKGGHGTVAHLDEFDPVAVHECVEERAAETGRARGDVARWGTGYRRTTLTRVRVLGVEFDSVGIPEQVARLRTGAALGLPAPTCIVFSGARSLHVLWRLEDGVELDLDTARRVMRGMQTALRSDPGAVGVPRRWRAGGYDRDGTTQALLALGPRAGSDLIEWGLRYAPPPKPSTQPVPWEACPVTPSEPADPATEAKARKYLASVKPCIERENTKHLFHVVGALACRGVHDVEQAVRLLVEEYNPRCQPPWRESKIRHAVTTSRVRADKAAHREPQWKTDRAHALKWSRQQARPHDPDELLTLDRVRAEYPDLTKDQVKKLPAEGAPRGHRYRRVCEAKAARVEGADSLAATVAVRAARIADGDRSDDLRGPTLPALDEVVFDADDVAKRIDAAERGVFGVRAGMGLGKTVALERALNEHEGRVLVVTPTVKQANALALRLQCEHYRAEDPERPGQTVVRPPADLRYTQRLVVCLDSLWKVADVAWDVIVLDEVEDTLNHLDGETVRLVPVARALQDVLRSSRLVLCVDADLRQVTLDTLSRVARAPLAGGVVDPVDRKQRALVVWEGMQVLPWLAELDAAVARGRVAVACDSLTAARRLAERYRTRKVLLISSEHAAPDDLVGAVRAADVVVWTPSIRASVSLDGEGIDGEYEVFGWFVGGRPQSAFQSLGRIRNPRTPVWRVWVGWHERAGREVWEAARWPDLQLVLDTREQKHWWTEVRERRLLVAEGAGMEPAQLKRASAAWKANKADAWQRRRDEVAAAPVRGLAPPEAPKTWAEALRLRALAYWGPNHDVGGVLPLRPDDLDQLRERETPERVMRTYTPEWRLQSAALTAAVYDAVHFGAGRPAPELYELQDALGRDLGPKAHTPARDVERVIEACRGLYPWSEAAAPLLRSAPAEVRDLLALAKVGDPDAPRAVDYRITTYALARVVAA